MRAIIVGVAASTMVAGAVAGNGATDPEGVRFADYPGARPDTTDVEEVLIPGTDTRLRFRRIPAGSFLFGSPEDEPGRGGGEGPRIPVSISEFWMMETELTSEQYAHFRYRERDNDSTASGAPFDADAVSRPSPPYDDPYHGMGGGSNPATGMTWWAAMKYARWLSEKTGLFLRLPTEAEFEYACRAGSDSAYGVSDDPAEIGSFAWYAENSSETTHPVGEKLPNAWGLGDVNGNVAEWTLDQYRIDAHDRFRAAAGSTGVVQDPWSRPDRTHPRTVRGGAFDDPAEDLRCARRLRSTRRWKHRDPQIPKSRWWNTDSPFLGFRLVRPVEPPPADSQAIFWRLNLGED